VSDIVRKQSPEEAELESKQAELATLEQELTELELELATIQGTLANFNATYLNHLGDRFVRIDELKQRIAQIIALTIDEDEDVERVQAARAAAEEATEQARATAEQVHEYVQPDFEPEPFKPTPELKQTFRKAARMVHPDLAKDDADRERRERLMAEVNVAYESGNVERILEIMEEAELLSKEESGEDVGAKLVRLIRQVAAVRKRIESVQSDVDQVKASDLWSLHASYAESLEQGGNLLDAMASELDKEIEALRDRLKACREAAG
jgi:hypothetical protein